VEGELGVLGLLETGMGDKEDDDGAGQASHDQLLTNPDEAVKFVTETKVDALAIAMGLCTAPTSSPGADGDIPAMKVIRKPSQAAEHASGDVPGSSVPQDRGHVNANGGKDEADLGRAGSNQRGIKNGVRKITSTPTTAWR
jgi:fructose-bisphosphate aldolase class II